LPAPGQTILGSTFCTTPGGKGANQAVAARRAGADVVFVTAVGNDDLGKQALEAYRREGIDVGHVRTIDAVASGVAMIFVGDDGENMIGVAPGANQRLSPDDVDHLPASLFRKDDVLLVSLEIPVETAVRALQRGLGAGMYTILNPAPAPALAEPEVRELLSAAIAITPNRLEALTLAGLDEKAGIEPDWSACGCRLKTLGPAAVIITLGSRGCQVVAAKSWFVNAPRVEAIDTVGAGDAFNGALAAALAEARDLATAVALASAAAALAVTQPGAQSALPFRAAIDQLAARAGTCY
jgi:ribokinase